MNKPWGLKDLLSIPYLVERIPDHLMAKEISAFRLLHTLLPNLSALRAYHRSCALESNACSAIQADGKSTFGNLNDVSPFCHCNQRRSTTVQEKPRFPRADKDARLKASSATESISCAQKIDLDFSHVFSYANPEPPDSFICYSSSCSSNARTSMLPPIGRIGHSLEISTASS